MASPTLSIVAPAYNEERNIPAFLAAIVPVLERIGETFEIVFVDDGSRDGTLGMLAARASQDPRIKVVGLARNFGKDVALSAGPRARARPRRDPDRLRPAAPARADPASSSRSGARARHGDRRPQQARRRRLPSPHARRSTYYR